MGPPIRSEWVRKRTGPVVTQMHYARQGIITEEMDYVAQQENLPLETIRAEGADVHRQLCVTPKEPFPLPRRRVAGVVGFAPLVRCTQPHAAQQQGEKKRDRKLNSGSHPVAVLVLK